MDSEDTRKPVFIRRKGGMPFKEFVDLCCDRLEKEGYFKKDRQSQPPPDEPTE